MRKNCFALFALLAFGSGSAFAEEIENPEYAVWSKFKKGASVTVKTVTSSNGMTFEMKATTTLVEVAKDGKLVLEISAVSNFNGMEIKAPAMKRDVTKTIKLPEKLPAGVKKEDYSAQKPPGSFEEGTEDLKIAGKEIKTKWFKFKSEVGGLKSEGQVWHSDKVPGGVVKMESTTGGGTVKMELVEFKEP